MTIPSMRWAAAAVALSALAACAAQHRQTTVPTPPPPAAPAQGPGQAGVPPAPPEGTFASKPTRPEVDNALASWPSVSRQVAEQMIAKYGLPDEATASLLIWHGNGDWKRSVVHRDLYDHNFPQPHADVLEQVIEYRVPADKLAELDQFDGSLSFNRTRGELTSWAQTEEDNRLQLALADDVVRGRRTAADARDFMARSAQLRVSGKSQPQPAPFWKKDAGVADPDSPAPFNSAPAWP